MEWDIILLNDLQGLKKYIEYGGDLNNHHYIYTNPDGTMLLLENFDCYPIIYSALQFGNYGMVDYLIQRGAFYACLDDFKIAPFFSSPSSQRDLCLSRQTKLFRHGVFFSRFSKHVSFYQFFL